MVDTHADFFSSFPKYDTSTSAELRNDDRLTNSSSIRFTHENVRFSIVPKEADGEESLLLSLALSLSLSLSVLSLSLSLSFGLSITRALSFMCPLNVSREQPFSPPFSFSFLPPFLSV